MDLTAERFAQLIQSLSTRRIVERSRENRTEQRSGVRYRLTIRVPAMHETRLHRAWLRDFSSTGLGIATGVVMTAGQGFAIQMQSNEGPIEIACTAAHCQRVAEDVYNIGARFMDRWYTKLPEAA
jgi:hypothetical protein